MNKDTNFTRSSNDTLVDEYQDSKSGYTFTKEKTILDPTPNNTTLASRKNTPNSGKVPEVSYAIHSENTSLSPNSDENIPMKSYVIKTEPEKRGKFIDDNVTNTTQTNLPNMTEVRTVKDSNLNRTIPKTSSFVQKLAKIEASTEGTPGNSMVSSNSEKNLIDWAKIMIDDELQNKNDVTFATGNQSRIEVNGKVLVDPTMRPIMNKRGENYGNESNKIEANSASNKETNSTSHINVGTDILKEQIPINSNSVADEKINNIRIEEHTITVATTAEADMKHNVSIGTLNKLNVEGHTVPKIETIELQPTSKPTITISTPPTMTTSNGTESPLSSADNKYENSTDITHLRATAEQSLKTSTENRTGAVLLESADIGENKTHVAEPTDKIVFTTTAIAIAAVVEASTTTTLLPENHERTTHRTPVSVPSSASKTATFKYNEVHIDAVGDDDINDDDAGDVDGDVNDGDSHDAALEFSPSEATTSTTAISALDATVGETGEIGLKLIHGENKVNEEKEIEKNVVEEPMATEEPTTIKIKENFTTEVGQIGNVVDKIHVKTEQETATSSANETHLNENREEATETTATTKSAASAQLINIITAKPIEATTMIIDTLTTESKSTANGIDVVEELSESPLSSTSPKTLVEDVGSINSAGAAHDFESSIDINAVDPSDKSSVTPVPIGKQNTKSKHQSLTEESNLNSLGEEQEDNNERNMLQTFNRTSVTIEGTPLLITNTTSTVSPVISLLDDTTTTADNTTSTTKVPPSNVTTNIKEVYSIFSTTTGSSTIESLPTTTSTTPDSSLAPSTLTSTIMLSNATGVVPTHIPTVLIGDVDNTNLQSNSSDAPETDVNVVIAISVSVVGVVALILLVAFFFVIRKRQKQLSYGQRCRPVSLDAYSLDNVSALGSVRRKGALRASKRSYGNAAFDDPSLRHNVLAAVELAKFMERRSSIFEEFRDVPQITARADEVPQGCEDKNRYANVIPLPETRVVLQQQNGDEKTEYINANYVRGPKDVPNYYIACQAPLDSTVTDFWRMVWEQQSRVIIQATDLMENGIEKCAEYLPPSVTLDNHTSYGDYQVILKHREVKDKYAISTLVLKNTLADISRELMHYWYKWPETGVPSEEASIIAMLLEVRSSLKSYAVEQANELKEKSSTLTLNASKTCDLQLSPTTTIDKKEGDSRGDKDSVSGSSAEINGNMSAEKLRLAAARNQGPLTIHCSPGTGRTGTIIACDIAIRCLEMPKRTVDIPQIVYYVRRGRASAVQTKEQYEFIYKVANMYASKITNLSNDN